MITQLNLFIFLGATSLPCKSYQPKRNIFKRVVYDIKEGTVD